MKALPYRERISKLAQWAQRYIAKLEKDVAFYKKGREQIDSSETAIYWYFIHGENTHLPD